MARQTGTPATGPTGGGDVRAGGSGGSSFRSITRRRSLPGGRAVTGALLVTLAALAVFVAYLDASAAPSTRYLVAHGTVAPGTVIGSPDAVRELFGSQALDLPPALGTRAVAVEAADELVGRVVVSPLADGELLQRGALVVAGEGGGAHVVSLGLAPRDALAGDLAVGQEVDVLATYTRGMDGYTMFVARAVPVTAVADDGGGGLGGGELVVTLAVRDPQQVQALGHAARTASVFLSRPPVGGEEPDDDPAVYRAPDPGPVEPVPPDEEVIPPDGVAVPGAGAGPAGGPAGGDPGAGS